MTKFNLTPQKPTNGMTVLELFCGGGLGAIGFKAAGYVIVKALDFDKNAAKAYRHNFGDYVEQADINKIDIDSLPDTDVIFGGLRARISRSQAKAPAQKVSAVN